MEENMYAIVEVLGEQVKAEKGEEIIVPYMSERNEGEKLELDKVMLISNDGEPVVGKPYIEGATINTSVIGHIKGDKVIVFKKKRRTGYHKKQGHREKYTKLMVDNIEYKKAKAKPVSEKETED